MPSPSIKTKSIWQKLKKIDEQIKEMRETLPNFEKFKSEERWRHDLAAALQMRSPIPPKSKDKP